MTATMLIIVTNPNTQRHVKLNPPNEDVARLARVFEHYEQITFEAGQLCAIFNVAQREVTLEGGEVARYCYRFICNSDVDSSHFSEVMRQNGFAVTR